MVIYRLCNVKPNGMHTTYYYIAPEEVKVGTQVLIPFGKDNTLMAGMVLDVEYYTEDELPFPLEKLKTIEDVLKPGELEAAIADRSPRGEYAPEEWDYIEQELAKVQEFLEMEDDENALGWAEHHHEETEHPEIMEQVVAVYEEFVARGNAVAALNLGSLYYTGTFLEQDYMEAARLYKIAADTGEEVALCNLGYCYYYGRHQAVDYPKAYKYFSMGALLYDNPNCLYKLGDMYRDGHYVAKNEKFAVQLYFKALDACYELNADDRCIADIHLRIGTAFLHGMTMEQNAETAHLHLSQALTGFYKRRRKDPFVGGLITQTKELLKECEIVLDAETI